MRYLSKNPVSVALLISSLVPLVLVLVYASQNAYTFPVSDQWTSFFAVNDSSSIDVANKAAEGTLTIYDLYYQHTGHRIVTNKITTAFLARFGSWTHTVELGISIALAVGNWLLLIILFWRQQRSLWPLAALAFSLLIFALRQDNLWKTGYLDQWFFVKLFLVAGVLVLYTHSVSWRTLIITALLTVCASFSLFVGLLAWPVLLVSIWLRGYRHPRFYIFWLVAMLLTIGVYFYSYDFSRNPLWAATMVERGIFVLGTLGSTLVPFDYDATFYTVAVAMGLLGLVGVSINALYLARTRQGWDWSLAGAWLTLTAYAVGSGALLSFTRFATPADALLDRYIVASNLLWVAFIALSLLTLARLRQKETQTSSTRLFMVINSAALALLFVLYIIANSRFETQAWYPQDRSETQVWANCVLNYPIDKDDECLAKPAPRRDEPGWYYERTSRLAINRLSVFADLPLTTALDTYQTGDAVIIVAPTTRQQFHIYQRLPETIRRDDIYYFASAVPDQFDADLLGGGAQYLNNEADVSSIIAERPSIWYVYSGDDILGDSFTDKSIVEIFPAYEDPQQPFTVIHYQ